jgi:hypothetical protein
LKEKILCEGGKHEKGTLGDTYEEVKIYATTEEEYSSDTSKGVVA